VKGVGAFKGRFLLVSIAKDIRSAPS